MNVFDAVSPLERIQLSGALAGKVQALSGTVTPLERIKLARDIADILEKLGEGLEAAQSDELSDDPNSPNYRYRDTGYIADSRKEKAANMIRLAKEGGQRVLTTDLDWEAIETNPRAAAEIITKSNLFGSTDWDRLKTEGMEPAAGFLIDRVYAAIAPQPTEETPRARQDYAMALQSIRDRLEGCVTPENVTTVLDDIKDELTGVQLNAEEATAYAAVEAEEDELRARYRQLQGERDALANTANGFSREISGLQYTQSKRTNRKWKPDPEIDDQIATLTPQRDAALADLNAWEAANPDFGERYVTVRDGNGGVSASLEGGLRSQIGNLSKQRRAITEAAKVRNITESPVTRGWLTFGERFFGLLHFRSYKGSDAFASHVTNAKRGKISDWSWAEKERVTVKRATKQEIGFQMRVAENYERVGGTPVSVDSTLSLKAMLGFRDVQSGNWVLKDPNSAKFHVEQTAGAMLDMSDVLGIDAGMLGLGGRLGMAFGARGTGSAGWQQSAAKATYESVHRVINLTKMGGGGSLGHEWGHALDDILGELASGEATSARNFASEEPSVLPSGPLRDAMVAVRSVMNKGTKRLSETIKIGPKDKQRARYNIDSSMPNTIAKMIKAAGSVHAAVITVDDYFAGRSDKRSLKTAKDWRTIAAAYYAEDGATEVEAYTGPLVSSFRYEAVRLDEGVQGKYWSRQREMYARAFQSYLEDRLADKARKNDYLSVYADNKYHYDPILNIQWNPYPEGEERTAINAAFDRFFDAIRGERVFEKAVANTALLDSIFGPLIEQGAQE